MVLAHRPTVQPPRKLCGMSCSTCHKVSRSPTVRGPTWRPITKHVHACDVGGGDHDADARGFMNAHLRSDVAW
ncbi:hypothetical protein BHE74_00026264 [Ensete ventricosum]|nr:hypothetical protein BHE74_00026264 [Ensete ventricosum]